MKNNFKKLLLAVLCFLPQFIIAQNLPDATTATPGAAVIDSPPANFSGVTLLNYTRTWYPEIPVTDPNSLTESSSAENIRMISVYSDGMGRSIQKVTKQGAGQSWDIVEIADNRQSRSKLNFLPYSKLFGGGKFRPMAYTEQRDYYLSLFPDEEATAYSKVTYDKWVTKSYSPGKATVGQNRGIETSNEIFTGSGITRYSMDMSTYLPVSSGDYGPKELVQKISINADGATVREFFDKESKLICSHVLQDAALSSTYFVYDNLGRLVFTITPKAYELSGSIGAGLTNTVANNLCYYTKYDDLGRVYEKHIPGESGNESIVYDRKGRAVFMQSPLLKSRGQWKYIQYDKLDREISTGLYTSLNTQSYLQDIFDGKVALVLPATPPGIKPADLFYYLATEAHEGSYPDYLTNCSILNFNYYDNYSYAQSIGRSASSGASLNPSYLISPSSFDVVNTVRGKLTATRTKILKPSGSGFSDWITELHYYDLDGNVVLTQIQNCYGVWDTRFNQYDFAGKLLLSVLDHNNPSCVSKPHTVIASKFSYNSYTFTLHGIEQEIDLGGWTPISALTYNEQGRIANNNIGGGVENQAFSYDIRGRLTGINKPYAEELVPSNTHFFGEALFYEYGFNKKLYCGNVSGMQWRNAGSSPRMSYGYKYNPGGRLLEANYLKGKAYPYPSIPGVIGYGWANDATDYTVSNLSYDANGNILSMTQKGVPVGASTPVTIDQLTYTYEDGGASNRLLAVNDAISSGLNASYKLNDFIDNNGALNDYSYDENGNLKKDYNKNIVDVIYNHQDLLDKVEFGGGKSIQYVYDAAGNKISQQINDGVTVTTYDYAGPFVYKNNVLQFVLHKEGVSRYHEKSPSVWGWDNDFFIKDHLGNVRSTVTAEPRDWLEYQTTFELQHAAFEAGLFAGIDPIREDKPFSYSPDDLKAARLSANEPDRRAGAAIVLKIMAGDQFELSASNFYDGGYNPGADQPLNGESMFTSVVTALVGNAGPISGGEGALNSELAGQLFSPENYLNAYQPVLNSVTNPTKPKAFINYMVFDENMKLVAEESGAIQANSYGQWQTIGTNSTITVGTNGYLVAYLSSATRSSVYFDNFRLRIFKGKLVEEHHYYPYGLAINAGSMNPMEKKYLYQGKELQTELGMMWQDFHARQYDPQLGRFNNIDPKSQFNSGYIGMGNNPVVGVDPDGEWVQIVVGAVIGGVVNVAANWNNIDNFSEGFSSFIAGAASGALTSVTGVGGAIAGGVLTGATNNVIAQTGNGVTLKDVKVNQVALSSVVGGVSSLVGYGASQWATNNLGSALLGNVKLGPVLTGMVNGGVGGGAGGAGGGFAAGYLLSGGDMKVALSSAVTGLKNGLVTGTATGASTAYVKSIAEGVSPWSGKNNNPTPQVNEPEAAKTGSSLGAGRAGAKQWLQNAGNLERGELIQNIESVGFKRMSPTSSPVSVFERGGMRIRLDPPQSGTPFNHMHLEYGGKSYNTLSNPVHYKSPAAHIPIR